MAQANTQRAQTSQVETALGPRPVATFKQGTVEVAVWPNQTEKGTMYNTTISNSYLDDKSGEWKETTSFSPADLAVLGMLSAQAFQAIVGFKAQSRSR